MERRHADNGHRQRWRSAGAAASAAVPHTDPRRTRRRCAGPQPTSCRHATTVAKPGVFRRSFRNGHGYGHGYARRRNDGAHGTADVDGERRAILDSDDTGSASRILELQAAGDPVDVRHLMAVRTDRSDGRATADGAVRRDAVAPQRENLRDEWGGPQ